MYIHRGKLHHLSDAVYTPVLATFVLLAVSVSSSVQQRVVKPGGKKFSRKERPMGGRKDKEARELALRDQQEVCVVWVGVRVCRCSQFYVY